MKGTLTGTPDRGKMKTDGRGVVIEQRPEVNHTEVRDNKDLGTVVDDLPAYVPPGNEYVVAFVREDEGVFRGRGRSFLWFEIVSPADHQRKRVYLCCPKPKDGKTKYGMGSNLVKAWMVATGVRPTRLDRLNCTPFRNRYFRAVIETVKTNADGDNQPESLWYSKINRLLSIAAGVPAGRSSTTGSNCETESASEA
jgi:hypothetical protein